MPINQGATQKPGPTPLGSSLKPPPGLETLNANDSRMNQVVNVGGVLYGGVNTTVVSGSGPARVGIAYFTVEASQGDNGLRAGIRHQGYVALDGENGLFPSVVGVRLGA